MAQVTVEVSVKTDDLVPVVVAGYRVFVFSAADVQQQYGDTAATGKVSFMLDGAVAPGTSYLLRGAKSRYSVPAGQPQEIKVLDPPGTEGNKFLLEVHAITDQESSDPNLCRVTGRLVDVMMRPLAGAVLEFQPRLGWPETVPSGLSFTGQPSVVATDVLLRSASVTTDQNGEVSFLLPRTGLYDVRVNGVEDPITITDPVVVPDAASINLSDLLFPYVKLAVFTPGSIALSMGQAGTVDVTITASNQQSLDASDISLFTTFVSDDEGVVTVQHSSGILTLTAVGAGTAVVSAERRVGTVAPRFPLLPDVEGSVAVTVA